MAGLTLAGQLIERANALAAGKSGAGNVMPKDWMQVWQDVMRFDPEQAARAHGIASTMSAAAGRMLNEGEIEGVRSSIVGAQSPAQPAVDIPPEIIRHLQNKYGAGTINAMLADYDRNGAQLRNMAQEFGWGAVSAVPVQPSPFIQPSDPYGSIPRAIIEQLKQKYGAGTIEQMVAEPEKYGAQLRNMAQEFTGGASAVTPKPRGPMTAQPGGTATHGGSTGRVARPWQVNPAVWDSLGTMGQQLALSFAEDEGWDAGDYVSQINATRPLGTAPRSVTTQYQQPRGLFR